MAISLNKTWSEHTFRRQKFHHIYEVAEFIFKYVNLNLFLQYIFLFKLFTYIEILEIYNVKYKF